MDIFEKTYELENQLILRLPQKQAEKLKEIILAGNLKDRLSMNFQADHRQGKLTLDGEVLNVKLYDLPCLIESLKTLDMKTFYKTSDIAQIMVCSTEEDNETTEQPSKAHYLKEKKHLWPHGITPPLKNVRHRRFRKTARKKYGDSPDVQKEVMRLLKADMEAVSVKYEIVQEKDKKTNESTSNQAAENESHTATDELHKIFQDISSSDSDGDEPVLTSRWNEFSVRDLPTGVPVVTDPAEREHLESKVEQLADQLAELEKRKNRKENLLLEDNIQNAMLKQRFQHEFEELTHRFNETRQQYFTCLVMLGRTK